MHLVFDLQCYLIIVQFSIIKVGSVFLYYQLYCLQVVLLIRHFFIPIFLLIFLLLAHNLNFLMLIIEISVKRVIIIFNLKSLDLVCDYF